MRIDENPLLTVGEEGTYHAGFGSEQKTPDESGPCPPEKGTWRDDRGFLRTASSGNSPIESRHFDDLSTAYLQSYAVNLTKLYQRVSAMILGDENMPAPPQVGNTSGESARRTERRQVYRLQRANLSRDYGAKRKITVPHRSNVSIIVISKHDAGNYLPVLTVHRCPG